MGGSVGKREVQSGFCATFFTSQYRRFFPIPSLALVRDTVNPPDVQQKQRSFVFVDDLAPQGAFDVTTTRGISTTWVC